MSEIDKMIGAQIKEARRSRGLSQTELARLIDKNQRSVSEYETGRTRITIELLRKVAQALNYPLVYFLPELKEPDDRSTETGET